MNEMRTRETNGCCSGPKQRGILLFEVKIEGLNITATTAFSIHEIKRSSFFLPWG